MVPEGEETTDAVKQLGGNISLINFEMDTMHGIAVRKIAGNYAKKLAEIADYKEIKIRLKTHAHGKAVLHEIDANTELTGHKDIMLSSNTSDYNLFSALSAALEKIISEARHKVEQQKK